MTDLEQELKQLKPRELSADTLENINREVGSSQPATPAKQHTADGLILFWGRPLLRAAAVLAVALGLAALLFTQREEPAVQQDAVAQAPPPQTVATNEPEGTISMSTVLVGQEDEGTIVDPTYGPVRRVRCRFVDNVRWDHPRTGGAVIRQTPREEIVLVSVPVD